jgi:two-component system, NarL family, sensor histidine kinase BarA
LTTLNEYRARPLYQPLSRSALIQLLSNQPLFEEDEMESFNGQGLHILAVDDHLPNLIVLEALLGELNVKTTKALSGQQALEILQERAEHDSKAFDLVFMDIQMPVMSGVDTTRAIRALESTIENHKRLPIIALTAHALADEKQKLLQVAKLRMLNVLIFFIDHKHGCKPEGGTFFGGRAFLVVLKSNLPLHQMH